MKRAPIDLAEVRQRVATLREAVMAMPADERLEYVLACWEDLTGQDQQCQQVDGVHLTKQQAMIFALLNRRIGRAVATEAIISMLDAGRGDAVTSVVLVRSQITLIRRKLAGKYRIRYSGGYILERVS